MEAQEEYLGGFRSPQKSGETVEVKIADKGSNQPTLEWMQKFYPEATRTV